MIIPGYSQYSFENGVILNLKTNREVKVTFNKRGGTGFVKLKNDLGDWKSIAISKVVALCYPEKTTPPLGFVLVPGYTKTYVNKIGEVWIGPGTTKPIGSFGCIYIHQSGYPYVTTEEINNSNSRAVHQLLALTFLDPDYLSKGLCVMHLDDDKLNYSLSNLKVSTYSENNKAAYETGVNTGRRV